MSENFIILSTRTLLEVKKALAAIRLLLIALISVHSNAQALTKSDTLVKQRLNEERQSKRFELRWQAQNPLIEQGVTLLQLHQDKYGLEGGRVVNSHFFDSAQRLVKDMIEQGQFQLSVDLLRQVLNSDPSRSDIRGNVREQRKQVRQDHYGL